MVRVYLDDVRTPHENDWIVVRNYEEFVYEVNKYGFDNISCISLDHDLGDEAMTEYYTNVKHNKKLDYDNIFEKTGMDCCKFLVEKSLDENKSLPQIYVHSQNPIGSINMIGYINNYLKYSGEPPTCEKIQIPHSLHHSHTIPLEERRAKWDKFFNLNKPKSDD